MIKPTATKELEPPQLLVENLALVEEVTMSLIENEEQGMVPVENLISNSETLMDIEEASSTMVEGKTLERDSQIVDKGTDKEKIINVQAVEEDEEDDESEMSDDDRELEDNDSDNDSNKEDDIEVDEDAAALVPIKLPTKEELVLLRSLFPEPKKFAVSYLKRLKPNGQSRCLAILNLPTYFIWTHVVIWIKKVAKFKGNKMPKQILRTNKGGYQCFWLLFKNQGRVATFRGFTHDRQMKYCKRIKCEFVKMTACNSACGRSYDGWTRAQGFETEHNGSVQFNQLPLTSRIGPSVPAPAEIPLSDIVYLMELDKSAVFCRHPTVILPPSTPDLSSAHVQVTPTPTLFTRIAGPSTSLSDRVFMPVPAPSSSNSSSTIPAKNNARGSRSGK